jgi:hypothetical protein
MQESYPLLWRYLSETQKQLAGDGQLLIEDRNRHPNEHLSDYSYLVFPFAKLYEGFLKQLFLDLRIISQRDYQSTHFRVGKALSPNIMRRLGNKSAYAHLSKRYGDELAATVWATWKQGRNLVFHYFPHNVSRLSFMQAKEVVARILSTMERAVAVTQP